jgi:Domain of unknown function (DUF5916)/Carbohydrate family 9 binding domain-like
MRVLPRLIARLVAVATCTTPMADAQQAAAPDSARVLTASRAQSAVRVDGLLDDSAWVSAAVATSFRQREPSEGAAATLATEVRVLWDDDALYVGARMRDPSPDSIIALLARRDEMTPSDEFFIGIDGDRDRRTAYVFSVTPRGTRTDVLIYNDNMRDPSWDAVWQAATRIDGSGWTAEMRIPLTQLRVRGDSPWGVNFFRWIARRREDTQWALIPRASPAWVSHYGELRGVAPASTARRLEMVPYTLGRVTRAPTEAANPFHRRMRPAAALGADLKAGLGPFTITAAINPDFGQVEADPSEVNLTSVETFLEEKRPFFVEGVDLFDFSLGYFFGSEKLFYSRRIGRRPQASVPGDPAYVDEPDVTTILAAAKLTGRTARGWSIGLLDAVTGEERARLDGDPTVPSTVPVEPMTNYTVARVMRDLNEGRTVIGAIGTAMHRRLNGAATFTDLRSAAYSGGFDVRHRFGHAGQYRMNAYVLGTHVRGSTEAIDATQRASARYFQRPDAPHLDYDPTRTSLSGAGAFTEIWKSGGNWRWGATGRLVTPAFDANDIGYQPGSDFVSNSTWIGYESYRQTRRFRRWWWYLNTLGWWNTAGERLGMRFFMNSEAELPNGLGMFLKLQRDLPGLSPTELRGGPSLFRPARSLFLTEVWTNNARRVSGWVSLMGSREDGGGAGSLTVQPNVTLRPSSQLQLSVAPKLAWTRNPWQYVDDPVEEGTSHWVVGRLAQRTASLTARLSYTFTPDLSLQLYAHPFVSGGAYRDFRQVVDARAPHEARRFRAAAMDASSNARSGRYTVDLNDDGGVLSAFDDPSFSAREFTSSAVLRWEYRPGSTLFVAWSQARDAGDPVSPFQLQSDVKRLFGERPTNALLVKVSYWMGL